MARLIEHLQIKRGLEEDLPVLLPGEQAFTEDTEKLFIGSENGNIDITSKVDVSKLATKETTDTLSEALAEIGSNKIVTSNQTRIVGHRGLSWYAPENTLPAYELAAEYGLWGGETDVLVTADGEFVLMHDDTIDRTTNGAGKVSDLTFEQLRAFIIDAGSNVNKYPNMQIPTLKEFLGVCRRINLTPVLEVKEMSLSNVSNFVNTVVNAGFENSCIIISFSFDIMKEIRKINKNLYLQPLLDFTSQRINQCLELGRNTGIDVPEKTVTQELVDEAHSKGMLVQCYNVNDLNRLKELEKMGVDFIATDKLIP